MSTSPSPFPRLCLVTTGAIVVRQFLMPHLRQLAERFDVTLVANEDCSPLFATLPRPPHMAVVPIERKIHPLNDMLALTRLTRILAKGRFDAVLTIAPKAGLIGIAAGSMARVPYRCHVFQGEVWATRTGLLRWVLRLTDQLVNAAATETLVVSAGEREFLITEGILNPDRSRVLGSGSISGVDTARFAPNPQHRLSIRSGAGIPGDAPMLLFVGRYQRDKGLLDLVSAWKMLATRYPDLHLVIVGPDEENLAPVIRASIPPDIAWRLLVVGETSMPERWMAAADILCLPSYREGFGSVILEAAASAIPSVASRIYGLKDSVVENVTGLFHPPGDSGALAASLTRLLDDAALRQKMGQAGRQMALEMFEQDTVVARYADYWAGQCQKVTAR